MTLPHTQDDRGRGVFTLVPKRELSIRLSPPGFGRALPSSNESLEFVRNRDHRLFRTLSHTEGRVVGIAVSLGMVGILALMGLRWLGCGERNTVVERVVKQSRGSELG